MRVLLAGGGTGGHINPAIAIADYYKSNDKGGAILFAGTPNGMEAKMVKAAGYDFAPIEISGFSRSINWEGITHNVHTMNLFMRSLSRAKKIINKFEPDVVIGTGGYVSGPIVYMASRMKVRTAIHEQNAFPGVTTRFLASKVDIVYSAVAEAEARLKSPKRFRVVGNPIRECIVMKSRQAARAELNLDYPDRPLIFSFGGSLGADTINRMAADLIEWNSRSQLYSHIHGYGRLGKEKFPALLKADGINPELRLDGVDIRAHEYINNMDTCLAAADLVICRAGAITISELEAAGKAAILVPSPNVTENHQFHNAMVLKERDACILIEEKDYKKEELIALLESLSNNPDRIKRLGENAAKLAMLDTAKLIYKGIKEIVN